METAAILSSTQLSAIKSSIIELSASNTMTLLLKHWQEERLITALDRHFALEMAKLHHSELEQLSEGLAQPEADNLAVPHIANPLSELYLLLCALLSQHLSQQHTCLPIKQIALDNPMRETQSHCQILCSHNELLAILPLLPGISTISATHAVEDKEQSAESKPATPMVLDQEVLYLQRYYQFEKQVAHFLTTLATGTQTMQDNKSDATAAIMLDLLFPLQSDKQQLDWQKIATATAFTQRLAVITGGPGTGKTTTVTKLLFLLTQKTDLNIRLVAPTGKAAARLSESIKASKVRLKQQLNQLDHLQLEHAQIDLTRLNKVPEEASTLHRLLGVIPNSTQFRHHKDNPLRLDLLVVDEASMVDLPMMHKLLSALPVSARLILLGDQDQLASVEAGAVLADICAGLKLQPSSDTNSSVQQKWQMRYSSDSAARLSQLTGASLNQFISPVPMIGDSLSMLMHSHRFKGDAGIGQLANAVNNSDKLGIMSVWQKGYHELRWIEHNKTHASGVNSSGNTGLDELLIQAVSHYRNYLDLAKDPHSNASQIIDSYNEFRILCAMRAGEYGVDGINQGVTNALKHAKLISTEHEFYLGRPVIIQSNDYNLGLFNGDIGLILPESEQFVDGEQQLSSHSPRLMAHFIQADGTILKVLPARLPSHETCFAMTVHKSQGSEFSNVALVLPLWPSPAQKQLLTKELIYTAITRAKLHFTCLGSQQVFEHASLQATQRASGLARRLWR